MKRVTKLFTLAALVAAFALPSIASAQAVASVNLQKVFNECKERKDLQDKFRLKGDELNRLTENAKTEIARLRQQRDQFKAGSSEYDRANQDLRRRAVQLQFEMQFQQAELVNEQKRMTRSLHDKTLAAVAEVAKAKQISIVITQIVPPQPSEDELERLTPDQLGALMSQQNLLYVAPNADITSDVLTRLDATFVASNPGAATPSTPTPDAPAPTPPAP